mmetsp:Transcript_44235/g.116244  ORF Transcript_44235/g.116244 Transcript_44235/m.116244 type:complete len:221 (-) Transcript_44235:252-914(-)
MPTAGWLRLLPLLLPLLAFCITSSDDRKKTAVGSVATLDVASMQRLISQHDKVILLMHLKECKRTLEFLPTLEQISRQVATPIGHLDVRRDPSSRWVDAFKDGMPPSIASGVVPDYPVLKAFFRSAPPERRVHVYRGPATLEAVLDWATAIDAHAGPVEDLLAQLDMAFVPQPLEAGTQQPSEPQQREGAPRYAGREGTFNGPSLSGAYQYLMGSPKDEM